MVLQNLFTTSRRAIRTGLRFDYAACGPTEWESELSFTFGQPDATNTIRRPLPSATRVQVSLWFVSDWRVLQRSNWLKFAGPADTYRNSQTYVPTRSST